MKRLLFFVVGLLFASPTFAQIELGEHSSALKRVANIRSGFITIYSKDGAGYYLALNSTNQFEDSLVMRIGANIDEALESAHSFESLFDGLEKGAGVDFKDASDEDFHVSRDVVAMTPCLIFSKKGRRHAGLYIYYISDCRAVIRRLEKMKEQ